MGFRARARAPSEAKTVSLVLVSLSDPISADACMNAYALHLASSVTAFAVVGILSMCSLAVLLFPNRLV